MNILSLVFAILLILSFFIHTQLENYKHFAGIKKEYNEYMKNSDGEHFNKRQSSLYAGMSKKKKDRENDEEKGSTPGRGRINFRLIIDEVVRNDNPELAKQHAIALKELMKGLYQNARFYRKLEKKRPNFLEDLIKALQKAASEKSIRVIQDIENLHLSDEMLQNAYYQMMKGQKKDTALAQNQDSPTNFQIQIPIQREEDVEDEDDADEDQENDENENDEVERGIQSTATYSSLMDFIHIQPSSVKIRVYLAPTEVLRAIFIDEDTVQQILETREELSKKVKGKNGMTVGAAAEELSQFKERTKPGIKEDILDFKVTKTNVKKFR